MKIFLLTLASILVFLDAGAQNDLKQTQSSCLQEGVFFTNQLDIDNFRTAYPDCDVIIGFIDITGDNITNLEGLQGIKGIYSGLYIHDASQLTSLSGLDSLEYIVDLEISNTPLTSLEGLGKVNLIELTMDIHDMPTLASFAGFGNYPCVVGSLKIWNCDALSTLEGLEALSEVGAPLSIKENDALLNISGLQNIVQIGTIEIENNASLSNISDLNGEVLAGHLNIFGNTSLSVCDAPLICNFLSAPTSYIKIYGNAQGCERPAQIARSCGFTMPCLTNGMYFITSQAAADSFAIDYPGCKDLKGNLIIQGPEVNDLSGLMGITSDSGMVIIKNTSIENFHGLDSLKSVVAHLWIGDFPNEGNDSLTSMSGLENLETIGSRLNITSSSNLVNLEGLSNLKKVGILDVGANALLTSFQGLNQLDTISKYLVISNNSSLTDISSLLTVKSISEGLRIYNNSTLQSLYGLDNMVPGDMIYLEIEDNPLLTECDVKSVCSMLQMNIFKTIENNASGCASVEEVEEACSVGVKDQIIGNLKLYPNPADDFIMVSLTQMPTNCQMTIYNATAMQVMKRSLSDATEWINISALPRGIYLIHISSNTGITTGKFLKD